jgi:hypothetical protein
MQMVSKIEQDARRVDADDLIALALVLSVNTNSILLNRHARSADALDLTANFRQRADVVWGWADGRHYMPGKTLAAGDAFRHTVAGDMDFAAVARPDLAARQGHPAALAIGQLAAAAQSLLLYLDEGDGDERELSKRRKEVRQALQRVMFELDELSGDEGNGQG